MLPRGIRSTLRTLNETYRGYRRYFSMLIGLGILGAVLDGIGINALVPLISFLMRSEAPDDFISLFIMDFFALLGIPFTFRYLIVFIVTLFLLRAAALTVSAYVRGSINARYLTTEMGGLFRATMRSEWPFMVRQKGGYIQNTIFWDIKHTSELLDRMSLFAQSAMASLIYLVVAFNISAQITILTFLFGTAMLLGLRRPLTARMRILGEQTSVLEKSLAQHIIEYLHGFKAVKAAGAIRGVNREMSQQLERMRETFAKTAFVQGLGGILIQPLGFLFIMGVFAFSYGTHTLNLAAFAATLYLIQKIVVSFESTQGFLMSANQLLPFAENVSRYKRTVAEHREHEATGGKSFHLEQAIEFRNVSLSYESGTTALSNVSFRIPKGAMIGIIGGSGGGKTSLADLLLRLFKPSEGGIFVDDTPAEDIRLASWREKVAYVSQDAFLFNDTIAHNIRFYDDSVSDDDIRRAAKEAHIYEDIVALPEGFETVIGDRGVTLSGGQRQRISLARALARKPEVLVLDEVTSALDSELEKQIQGVTDELRGSLTLIVIAHRVSTVMSADSIIALQKGAIVEEGTPEELLADPDSYFSKVVGMQGGAPARA